MKRRVFTPTTLSALNKREPKGFTLIELLVVIAIISLLVSILLPSLNKAKDLAKSVICLSNVRHIGMAAILYTEDYEGYFFPHYDCRDRNNDGILDGPTWFYDGPTLGIHYTTFFARKYLGPDVISNNTTRGKGSIYDCALGDGTPFGWHINYGYSYAVGPDFTYFPSVNIISVTEPSEVVLFVDAMNYAISWHTGHWFHWNNPTGGIRNHPDGRFNAVFVDAHAATLGQDDLDDANFNL